jgi:hypothetical protein
MKILRLFGEQLERLMIGFACHRSKSTPFSLCVWLTSRFVKGDADESEAFKDNVLRQGCATLGAAMTPPLHNGRFARRCLIMVETICADEAT